MLSPAPLVAPPPSHAETPPTQSSGRVLHVRNLPVDATQQELAALCSPVGRVTQVLLLNTKPQAFVEFENAEGAARLLQHVAQSPVHLRGKTVYFQYSNRDSIGAPSAQEAPKPVLLVTISNLIYHVTVELLYTVFCTYGPVVKIVLFTKNGAFQALIQYMSVNSAANAKSALDGQNLYVGACSMRVQYSQLPDLTVKFNNDRSRNFLDPSLPNGGSHAYAHTAFVTYPAYHHPAHSNDYQQQQQQQQHTASGSVAARGGHY